MTTDDIQRAVVEILHPIVFEGGIALTQNDYRPETELQALGLDSLALALFSVGLETRFGTDPYSAQQKNMRWPVTIGDVVAFYEQSAK